MSNQRTQTDNAHIRSKIRLRKEAVSNISEGLSVLDLYAGNNILWSEFEKRRYYGIEVVKHKGNNLHADSLRVIPSLDLSDFNVIDVDSYGTSIEAIAKIMRNPTLKKGTIIVYTMISGKLSALPKNLVRHYNIDKMYDKCPSLFFQYSQEMAHGMLYDMGIKNVREYNVFEKNQYKYYGYFTVP